MITNLTKNGVIVTDIPGIGQRAYTNSTYGRQMLIADLPEDIVSEVMAVWGDNISILDDTPLHESSAPSMEDRLAVLEGVQLERILGGAL